MERPWLGDGQTSNRKRARAVAAGRSEAIRTLKVEAEEERILSQVAKNCKMTTLIGELAHCALLLVLMLAVPGNDGFAFSLKNVLRVYFIL